MVRLPKYLARLQKNARNKEYRLRSRGADALGVAEASPRLPASEVAHMSAFEQRAYAARLRRFNSSENRLHVYETGTVVPYKTYQTIERGQREYNERMRARVEAMGEIVTGVNRQMGKESPFRDFSARVEDIRYRMLTSGRQLGGVYVGGRVAQISIAAPTSPEQAARRAKMVREMTTKESDADRRRRVRRNAMQMLNLMGEDELARKISNLSANQFDFLVTVTNFFDLISTPFDSGRYTDEQLSRSNMEWASLYKRSAADAEDRPMAPERVVTVAELISDVRRLVPTR